MRNYVVVTPCKNEESNINKLADSMLSQKVLPKIWLILDDGSTDSTPQKLSQLKAEYEWIHVCRLEESKRDLGFHIGKITDYGFKLVMQICEEKDEQCDYIGMIDADMVLCQDFFEKIIERLDNNQNIGVAGGTVAYQTNGKVTLEKGYSLGGLMVWRKSCLLDIGGYPVSYSADSVSCVLASQKGWKIKKYEDILGFQQRLTSSAEGMWNGYKFRGESDYYRDYHLLYIILKFIKYSFKPPFYTGAAYLYGYIYGTIKIRKKIENTKVREYYRSKPKKLIGYYGQKIKPK